MRAKTVFTLIAAAGAGAIGLVLASEAFTRYEEPKYEVLQKAEDIEIRLYPPLIAAEVEVTGTQKEAANQAFRLLAGYIFGKNTSRDKIAMTVPVTESTALEPTAVSHPLSSNKAPEKMTMRFYMPSKYTLETLPEPVNPRIKFLKLSAARYAVIKFSGLAREDNCARQELRLRKYLKEQNLAPAGQAVRAFYNPPWTLPFLRRNEVWLPTEVL